MIQLRNVPAQLRRRLKVRAAMEGLSVSDYVLREIRKALERPTRQEFRSGWRPGPGSGCGGLLPT
jgi:antitoxin FitA